MPNDPAYGADHDHAETLAPEDVFGGEQPPQGTPATLEDARADLERELIEIIATYDMATGDASSVVRDLTTAIVALDNLITTNRRDAYTDTLVAELKAAEHARDSALAKVNELDDQHLALTVAVDALLDTLEEPAGRGYLEPEPLRPVVEALDALALTRIRERQRDGSGPQTTEHRLGDIGDSSPPVDVGDPSPSDA